MSGQWVVQFNGADVMVLTEKPTDMDERFTVEFRIDWTKGTSTVIKGVPRRAAQIVKMMPDPEPLTNAAQDRTLSDVLGALNVENPDFDHDAMKILRQLDTPQRQKGIEHVIRGTALGTLEPDYEQFAMLVVQLIREGQ